MQVIGHAADVLKILPVTNPTFEVIPVISILSKCFNCHWISFQYVASIFILFGRYSTQLHSVVFKRHVVIVS
jgi:hypothetical protein